MALQISGIRTNFDLLQDRDSGDITDSDFILWVNYAVRGIYRSIYQVDPERFLTTSTYSAVTSGSQNLPADFKTLEAGPNAGIFPVDNAGNDTEYSLPRTGFGSSKRGYYINRGSVVFTGISSATTFKLRYIPKLTTFTATTDYITLDALNTGIEVIPEEYEEQLLNDMGRLYGQWDKNSGAENMANFRFSELEAVMLEDITRDSGSFMIKPRNL